MPDENQSSDEEGEEVAGVEEGDKKNSDSGENERNNNTEAVPGKRKRVPNRKYTTSPQQRTVKQKRRKSKPKKSK